MIVTWSFWQMGVWVGLQDCWENSNCLARGSCQESNFESREDGIGEGEWEEANGVFHCSIF